LFDVNNLSKPAGICFVVRDIRQAEVFRASGSIPEALQVVLHRNYFLLLINLNRSSNRS